MAPRRARKATSAQISRYRATVEKSIANQIEKDINRKIARGIQEFAVKSMNTLAQQGPAWTGEFSASWGFAPRGITPNTAGTTGKIYKYTKNDVPINYIERYIRDGYTEFAIINTSPHANEAIDGTQATFKYPGFDAIKERELGDGRDNPSFRYEIGGVFQGSDPDEAPASRTADPDWYLTYVQGGGLQVDLKNGFSVGFQGSF